MNGFLFIDKEENWTSRDVCNKLQGIVKEKKVGHTGTLDPFATGLLVVALGSASKLIPYLEELDKTYIAELTLGKKTNTADLTGEVIEEKDIPSLTKEKVNEALKSFIGESMQLPPMTSAIHVNGEKLYKLAHKGLEVDRPKRKITVFDINLLNFEENRVLFTVRVSKGTYVRTLGEDIAERLGTVGHLTGLRRTMVGKYSIKDACKISEVNSSKVISIENIVSQFMETIYIHSTYIKKVKNGLSFYQNQLTMSGNKYVFLADKDTKEPLGIYELVGDTYKCARGLWS